MRAPDFWRQDAGLVGGLLAPMGWCYGLGTRLRFTGARPWRPPIPVLCIGNLVAGGAGKTPVALSLGQRLSERGANVHFLGRGYGGAAAGPLRVEAGVHDAGKVGDEALLLARMAPTWIARDRVAGARAAAGGADIIVMDDGFQDPKVAKDVSLLVVDGKYGFGNGHVIPAGPLREPIDFGLGRATGLVVVGPDESGIETSAAVQERNLPILKASITPGPEADRLKGKPVAAFAGIGDPKKFFATLEEIGCEIKTTQAFPDHHRFTAEEIGRLKSEADRMMAVPVTTQKDAMRIPSADLKDIVVLTISLEWADETSLDAVLQPLFD